MLVLPFQLPYTIYKYILLFAYLCFRARYALSEYKFRRQVLIRLTGKVSIVRKIGIKNEIFGGKKLRKAALYVGVSIFSFSMTSLRYNFSLFL